MTVNLWERFERTLWTLEKFCSVHSELLRTFQTYNLTSWERFERTLWTLENFSNVPRRLCIPAVYRLLADASFSVLVIWWQVPKELGYNLLSLLPSLTPSPQPYLSPVLPPFLPLPLLSSWRSLDKGSWTQAANHNMKRVGERGCDWLTWGPVVWGRWRNNEGPSHTSHTTRLRSDYDTTEQCLASRVSLSDCLISDAGQTLCQFYYVKI